MIGVLAFSLQTMGQPYVIGGHLSIFSTSQHHVFEICWATHVNIGRLCNAKVGNGKHGTPATTYQGSKKKFHPTDNVEYKCCFCPADIKHCVNGNKKYVLDWHLVPNMRPLKIGINLSREKVLALEDVGFQVQQREVFAPHRRLSTIVSLPIP